MYLTESGLYDILMYVQSTLCFRTYDVPKHILCDTGIFYLHELESSYPAFSASSLVVKYTLFSCLIVLPPEHPRE